MKLSPVLCFAAIHLLLSSCSGNGKKSTQTEAGDTLTSESSLLTLVDHGDYVTADIADPWNKDKKLAAYVLVPATSGQVDVPEGYTVIKTPVNSAAVFSSVHSSALEELGRGDVITAVADASYFTSPTIRNGLESGKICDVGNSMSPSLERLVEVSPQIMLVSPYQNSDHCAIAKAGIIVVPMADYKEDTPLGRAEWILFEGALTGRLDSARAIYQRVVHDYETIRRRAEKLVDAKRPLVLTDMEYSGQWAQPAGGSYAARMIADAGGRVIFDDNRSTGSVSGDYAVVYDRGRDADFWLIRSFGPLSRGDVVSANRLNADMRPMSSGKVYYTDTSASGYYEDIAFHPERILADYLRILHPELCPEHTELRYFKVLQ